MIFDESYDTSLWYIVKADKNRKELVEFLRGIPNELIEIIRLEINKVKNGESESAPEISKCACKDESNTYYYFDIDSMDMCLTITKGIEDGKMGTDLFELMLYPISLDEIKDMEYCDEEWLGTTAKIVSTKYIAGNIQETNEKECEFTIHRFPIGYYVSHTHEILNGKRELVLFRPISINRVPSDITRENILQRRLI